MTDSNATERNPTDAVRGFAERYEKRIAELEAERDEAIEAMNEAAGKWAKADARARELEEYCKGLEGLVTDLYEAADTEIALNMFLVKQMALKDIAGRMVALGFTGKVEGDAGE
jgi:hypothetical protein